MDSFLIMLVVLLGVAFFVYTQLKGTKPSIPNLNDIPSSSRSPRTKNRNKGSEKKVESSQWDEVDPNASRRARDVKFDPVKAGERTVAQKQEAVVKKVDTDQVKQRTKNRAEAAGFAFVESQKKRNKSADKVADEDKPAEQDTSAALQDRIARMNQILNRRDTSKSTSGTAATTTTSTPATDDKTTKKAELSLEKVKENLEKERKEKEEEKMKRAAVGGGKVVLQNAEKIKAAENKWDMSRKIEPVVRKVEPAKEEEPEAEAPAAGSFEDETTW